MTIQTPNYYVKNLKDLNTRYNIILSEFKTTWPKHKTHPSITQYSDSIKTDEENLEELQADFFQLKNDLENNIREILRNIRRTNIKIGILNKDNEVLSTKLNRMNNSNAASIGMVDDIQLRYNQYLLGNVIFGFAIIAFGYNKFNGK